MKRNIILLALITMSLAVLCSCKSEDDNEYEPDYTIFETNKGNNEDTNNKDTNNKDDDTEDANIVVDKKNNETINLDSDVKIIETQTKLKIAVGEQWIRKRSIFP